MVRLWVLLSIFKFRVVKMRNSNLNQHLTELYQDEQGSSVFWSPSLLLKTILHWLVFHAVKHCIIKSLSLVNIRQQLDCGSFLFFLAIHQEDLSLLGALWLSELRLARSMGGKMLVSFTYRKMLKLFVHWFCRTLVWGCVQSFTEWWQSVGSGWYLVMWCLGLSVLCV